MDPRIAELKSTTFSGRRLTRRQISDIQKTVALFPNHSRNELAKTICEHLNWVSAKGDYRVGACMKLLEALERHGILTLPPKQEPQIRDMTSGPVWTSAFDRRPELCADLADLRPLRLEPVAERDGRQLWNAFVDRHHYLGYRRPFAVKMLSGRGVPRRICQGGDRARARLFTLRSIVVRMSRQSRRLSTPGEKRSAYCCCGMRGVVVSCAA